LLPPSIAIVILNFNGRNYLDKFLPSVIASSYSNKKIIVADNASTDDSVLLVQQRYPSIEILINTQNEGFAGGYNWALQNVCADYYVLLNSDVEVTEKWIEPIIDLLENDKTIAACQPKILAYNNRKQFEYAGAAGGWIDCLGYPFSRGRIFDVLENDANQYNNIQEIFWATGAALFIKSTVFHELNGFDASFFAHQEEIDLCWRIQLAGYKIFVCPLSVVYHVGAGTLPRGGRKVFLNFRNNLLMLCKNLPLKEKLWKLPLRFLLDAISAWKGLFSGDVYFFTAIIKAHIAVLKAAYKGNIKTLNHTKPLHLLAGVYSKSIIWQHFIKGKTQFQQIVEKKQ
jgi:GT2 family glycosyltransferase